VHEVEAKGDTVNGRVALRFAARLTLLYAIPRRLRVLRRAASARAAFALLASFRLTAGRL
jgi:hypothetical protein